MSIIIERIYPKSIWGVWHYRNGVLLRPPLWTPNVCTDEGITRLLDVMWSDGTQIAAANWHVILFNTDTIPTASTTYAVPVFTEEEGYTEATRPVFDEAGVSSKTITNSASKASFIINASGDGHTIYGGALIGGAGDDVSTKGDVADSTGLMYAAAKFSSTYPVVQYDVLKVTVSIVGSDV